ncbi:MAG TPA: ABC transporter ATP-binding protein [Verrucomicrobiae bacterium]|nr:ABC transporter ATP-binding protein [Verrucomicrobiae bacterium]
MYVEFGRDENACRAVNGLSLEIEAGRSLALVGESGSGKSVTALSIARLVPSPPAHYPAGEIMLEGRNVFAMSKTELRRVRGGVVSYVFQEPGASLNPVFRIGSQIKESLKLHLPDFATDAEVLRLLRLVGIPAPEERANAYPHEISGGMQQRVMIAMALASRPKLLVADEPTTALDVTIQAQIIELLVSLKAEFGMSILLITHNLGIVSDLADDLAVMYAGEIVETGSAREVLKNPAHPYTRALINSVPMLEAETKRLTAIPGAVPQLGAALSCCRFHPRCPQAQPDCSVSKPELIQVAPGHRVRCPYWQLDHVNCNRRAESLASD